MADINSRRSVTLTADQREDIQEVFNTIDQDNSGHITASELDNALEQLNIKLAGYEIRDLIGNFDNGEDQKLDIDEFQMLYLELKKNKDLGILFKKQVQRREGICTHGGRTTASSAGTTHSVRTAEQVAFSEWINSNLSRDKECQPYLPLNPESDDLYKKMADGILLCKLINITSPDTIDERGINKVNPNVYRKHENLVLALNSARSIGCNIVNIGAEDIKDGTQHLVLGLLWQVIRIGLLSDIDLKHHPGLVLLLGENEEPEDLQKLTPEQILVRWVNYHLRNAGANLQINNLAEDIKDSEAYSYLLHQIAPRENGVTLDPLKENELLKRAEYMLQEADKIGCRSFITPNDVVNHNYKLNLAFVANLFNTYPALDKAPTDVDLEIFDETREEKTYRNWMNSVGVNPFVYNLYSDLTDGLVLLQLFDIVNSGIVNWSNVIRTFNKMKGNFEKLSNCNYAVDLGKEMKFSTVGICGSDIGQNKILTLAIVWQLMRAYTLSILRKLTSSSNMGDRDIGEKDIIHWANTKLKESGKTSVVSSLNDSNLSSSRAIVDLVDAIKPNSINYSFVKDCENEEDRLDNAKYAISMSRKIGARVYALPEDIVEVKPKMLLTIFACLMALDIELNSKPIEEE
ncbi:plastin-1 isoform X1 [Octopus vulgaris]|uniref:Plastin-1 isoform X1 n=1 Tax=Octopus vulgaris TaxID=6645 RepID=A0AA36F9Z2_OCTVU|nr:plastin-1 isoform X1 [Octopus vulgaris]